MGYKEDFFCFDFIFPQSEYPRVDPLPRTRAEVVNDQNLMMGRWLKHEFDIARMEARSRPNSYEYNDNLNLGNGESYRPSFNMGNGEPNRPSSFLQSSSERNQGARGPASKYNSKPTYGVQNRMGANDYVYGYGSDYTESDTESSEGDNVIPIQEVVPFNNIQSSGQVINAIDTLESSHENQATGGEVPDSHSTNESGRSRPEHRSLCEFCGFTTCRDEILANNEKAGHHDSRLRERAGREKTKYTCGNCDYGSDSIVEIEDHSHTHVTEMVSSDENIKYSLHNLVGFYICTSCPHNVIEEDKEYKVVNQDVSVA